MTDLRALSPASGSRHRGLSVARPDSASEFPARRRQAEAPRVRRTLARGVSPAPPWRMIEFTSDLYTFAPVRVAELGAVVSQDELILHVRGRKRNGERVVFTNGCFDLLHPGHVRLLEQARALGSFLIVAINSDASVRGMKGLGRPVLPEQERAEILAALAAVDYVTV